MIESTILKFAESKSKDVVNYILYIEESPNVVNYKSQSFIINDTTVDLSDYIHTEGTYNIGLASQDDVGNLSDIVHYNNITIKEIGRNTIKDFYYVLGVLIITTILIGLGIYFLK